MATFAVALTAVVSAVVLLYPHGDPASLPAALEGVFPGPGDVVVRQTTLEIDLPVGYDLVDLVVDGVPIPPAEVYVTEPTGEWTWQPGRGESTEEWTAGDHTVYVRWDRTAGGNPDPGDYTWTFRAS